MKSNRVIIIVASSLIALLVIAASVDLPLPEGISKNSVVESRIQSCIFKNEIDIGKQKSPLFVGIRVEDIDVPYLRWNPKVESQKIRKYCKEKARIKVEYIAQRILLRPKVTYWIKKLNVQTDS